MKVQSIFDIDVARSKSADDYTEGKMPFVTNTVINNGIVDYVEPFETDKVFEGPAICISGLGHATVHEGRFLPKGNGGDSCTILKPKEKLSYSELIYYAAMFNVLHRWRFSYGRKASKRRIEDLDISPIHTETSLDINDLIESNNDQMSNLFEQNKKLQSSKVSEIEKM